MESMAQRIIIHPKDINGFRESFVSMRMLAGSWMKRLCMVETLLMSHAYVIYAYLNREKDGKKTS